MPSITKTTSLAMIEQERNDWASWLADRPAREEWRVGLPPDPPGGVSRPTLSHVLDHLPDFRRQVSALRGERALARLRRSQTAARFVVVLMPPDTLDGQGRQWSLTPLPFAKALIIDPETRRAIGGQTGAPGHFAGFATLAEAQAERERWAERYPERAYRVARLELIPDD
jgi:hypothetical protein